MRSSIRLQARECVQLNLITGENHVMTTHLNRRDFMAQAAVSATAAVAMTTAVAQGAPGRAAAGESGDLKAQDAFYFSRT